MNGQQAALKYEKKQVNLYWLPIKYNSFRVVLHGIVFVEFALIWLKQRLLILTTILYSIDSKTCFCYNRKLLVIF